MNKKTNNHFIMLLNISMMLIPLGLAGCASEPDLSQMNAKIDAARTMAREAQDTANEALMKANALQNTQNEAIRRADTAQQTANAAQRTANQAIRAANASNGG
ncbi:alanine-zipper protein [Acidithiobacillus ferriphilus]|uniref:alanine-zipper protein n=1 Tax=Acidithiobacillus ferriphilus TaxID=1689834 RepID=UPI003F50F343